MSKHSSEEEPEPRVVIRDRRRIDPVTGAVRVPTPEATPATGGAASWAATAAPVDGEPAETGELRTQVAELTADLQRVTAEYANYRKRVDRDRVAVLEAATAGLLGGLVPVLDDFDRAAEHGELTGAFKAVADQFQAILGKLGLESFGAVGDPFDPALHEAVMHSVSAEVTEPTCVQVMRRGYRLGERLLRAAMVAVAEPPMGGVAEPPMGGVAEPPMGGVAEPPMGGVAEPEVVDAVIEVEESAPGSQPTDEQ